MGLRHLEMEISGRTGLIGLLGSPVAHSLSPAMHNEAFRINGLDYVYLAFDVGEGDLEQAVAGLKAMGARGWNLTMPDKTRMAELCDELSPAARIIGAVNTVVNDDGRLTGHITDGTGFMAMLAEQGVTLAGEKMVICGAGGAARAVAVQAALDGLGEIVIVNRSVEKAAEVAASICDHTDCAARALPLADGAAFARELEDAAILVNGTKLGMAPHPETCVVADPAVLRPGMTVADLVYNPRQTRLLTVAAERGCRAVGGLGMLLWQGAHAFRLWTGQDMPVEAVKRKVFS